MDTIFNDGARPTSWANLWLCLCTATPVIGDDGSTMDELSAAGALGYTRMPISFGPAGAITARKVIQDADITFPPAGADWPAVQFWAVVDGPDNTPQAPTNLLAFGEFQAPAFTTLENNSAKVTYATSPVEIEIQGPGSAGFTNWAVHKFLDHVFNYAQASSEWVNANVYVGLSTGLQLAATTTVVTEVSTTGTAYARVLVAENLTGSVYWSVASAGEVHNVQDVILGPPAGINWGNVKSMVLCEALTDGNVIAFDNSSIVDQDINVGDTVTFTATNLSVTLS